MIGDRFCEASNAEREPKKRAGERRAATFEAEGEASRKKHICNADVFFSTKSVLTDGINPTIVG